MQHGPIGPQRFLIKPDTAEPAKLFVPTLLMVQGDGSLDSSICWLKVTGEKGSAIFVHALCAV